jgi:hypothetical protein
MLKLTTPSRSLTIFLFTAALGSAACKTSVIGGGDGGGGTGGTDVGGSGGVGGAVATTAIAEYASMTGVGGSGGSWGGGGGGWGGAGAGGSFSSSTGGGTGGSFSSSTGGGTGGSTSSSTGGGAGGASTSSSSGGTGVDPNTLYVRIGNYGPTCGGSPSFSCDPVTVWEVSIGLPPAKQSAGGVYSLGDPDIISTFSESGGSGGAQGDCWGGGGSFTEGTVEILSNDSLTIVVRLSGTNGGLSDVSTDGTYSAPICQWGLD